jgi:hypothetical protein
LLRTIAGPKQSSPELFEHIGIWTFLTLWLAYGFAFGQFFTLMVRKNAVAIVLAVLVSAVVVALWVPSLVSGGVRLWHVLIVPVLLLAGVRAVLWSWAGSRLNTLRPVLTLAATATLALAWMAGFFWLRVVTIPNVGEPFDVRAFTKSLPTPEKNEAGRLIQRAAESLEKYEKVVRAEFKKPAKPQAHPGQVVKDGSPAAAVPQTFSEQMDDVVEKGWPKDRPDLGRWLDRMFEGEWAAEFRKAARMPLGMVVDLGSVNLGTLVPHVQYCREAAVLFTAQALRLQAQGNNEAALEHFGVVLGLSRQLRHKAIMISYLVGAAVESTALTGMDRWLRDLGPRPPLLRSALAELTRHEAQLPPLADCVKASYLMFLNERDNLMTRPRQDPVAFVLIAVASKVPWEEQRVTRLLHVVAANALRQAEAPLWEKAAHSDLPAILHTDWPEYVYQALFWYSGLGSRSVNQMRWAEAKSLSQLRGTELEIALALYDVEKGRPAATLDSLVPLYLPAVPVDPNTGKAFHYRISNGEQIEKQTTGPEAGPVLIKVPAGQGILWSLGPDRKYDRFIWSAREPDWIFLVPRWERKGER